MPAYDWDSVETSSGGTGGPLPVNGPDGKPAWYECRISKAEETTFRSGNDGFTLTLEVIDGPHKGNASLRDRLVFTPRAMPVVKSKLMAAGLHLKGKLNITEAMLAGKFVRVRLKPRNDGSEWPDVAFWDVSMAEPAIDPLAEIAKEFDAAMEAPPPDDGDIPF